MSEVPALDRLTEDGVDQADDRCVILLPSSIAGIRGVSLARLARSRVRHRGPRPSAALRGAALVGQGQFLLEGLGFQPVQRQHAAGEALGLLHGGQAGAATHPQLGSGRKARATARHGVWRRRKVVGAAAVLAGPLARHGYRWTCAGPFRKQKILFSCCYCCYVARLRRQVNGFPGKTAVQISYVAAQPSDLL